MTQVTNVQQMFMNDKCEMLDPSRLIHHTASPHCSRHCILHTASVLQHFGNVVHHHCSLFTEASSRHCILHTASVLQHFGNAVHHHCSLSCNILEMQFIIIVHCSEKNRSLWGGGADTARTSERLWPVHAMHAGMMHTFTSTHAHSCT